jgi:hypothetical protein
MSGYEAVPPPSDQAFYPNPSYQSQNQHYNQKQQYESSQHQNWRENQGYNPHQQYSSQTSFNPSINSSDTSQTSFIPYVQQSVELLPLIHDNATKRLESFTRATPVTRKQPTRRYADYFTILLTGAVWTFLTMACVVLLFFSYAVSQTNSEGGIGVTGDEIAGVIVLSSAPLLLATVLNEVLVERSWRRVVHAALGDDAASFTNSQMGKHLRAANFEWLNVMKRLWTHELSWHDVRSMASYGMLRFGTAISIASVQLCVNWVKTDVMDAKNNNLYMANKRLYFFIVPVVLHSISVFGTTTIWLMPPWALFSSQYDEHGLLERYRPYLQRVPNGSIAKYETVARFLDPDGHTIYPLEKEHRLGFQLRAKLKGIWFGLLLMGLAPGAALLYTWRTQHQAEDSMLRSGVYRFGFHLVFLAQNIFYILALDFVIWNLTIEGFCRGPRTKPNRNLRDLGYSSGLMLFWRALRQRRPFTAAIFMWMFWVQTVLVRLLTVLYTLCVVMFRYETSEARKGFYDPNFWVAYSFISALLVLPLFLVWIFTKFDAPISGQDGWRWAKIAQTALYEDGFYGVRNGEAAWGIDVQSFKSARDSILR